jgi:DNA-binding NarL/FixJ family response regulator
MAEPNQTIKVLIADDHPVVRMGLRTIFGVEEHIEIVAEATNGREAIDLVAACHPDVVLMDLKMPDVDGVAATGEILAQSPGTHVIVLTSFTDEGHIVPAIRAGAAGYLLKNASGPQVVAAVEAAAQGQPLLDPAVATRLLRWVAPSEPEPEPWKPLTPKEMEVLGLLVQGMSNRKMSETLGTSEHTVKEHVRHILAKLGQHDRTQAALFAVRNGIVPLT